MMRTSYLIFPSDIQSVSLMEAVIQDSNINSKLFSNLQTKAERILVKNDRLFSFQRRSSVRLFRDNGAAADSE
jgi:hypothetical protein